MTEERSKSRPGSLSRLKNTQTKALTAARELIQEHGADQLTYSSLAARSGITRSTLYRHWPAKQLLIAAAMLASPGHDYPEPGTDVRAIVEAYIWSICEGLSVPQNLDAFLTMLGDSTSGSMSEQAVTSIPANRLAALNELLLPAGTVVGMHSFIRLCGPVIYRVLLDRTVIQRQFAVELVDMWWLYESSTAVANETT